MISKELLSEVLDIKHIYKYYYIDLINQNNITIEHYDNLGIMSQDINIYELAHKCKEWALSKGILLRSSIDGVVDFYDFIIVGEDRGEFIDCREFKCSEVEAIINACEWILENKSGSSE